MGLTKYIKEYFVAIKLAAILIVVFYLSQLPFSIWLPGYTLLPEWLWQRTAISLFFLYFWYVLIPSAAIGTAIFYFRVLKNA